MMDSRAPALSIQDLSYRYGVNAALQDLSLSVPAGAVVGLIGTNGAGKTTTIRLCTGLLQLQTGSVRVAGVDLTEHPAAAKGNFALAPEASIVGFDYLSLREYLDLIGTLQKAGEEYRELVEANLAAFHLKEFANRRIGALSAGMQRKVALTAAISLARPLLILDEPTTGLDAEARLVLETLIGLLAKKGKATLLATQDLDFAERLCDEVILIAKGHVLTSGHMPQVIEHLEATNLRDAFANAVGLSKRIEDITDALGRALKN